MRYIPVFLLLLFLSVSYTSYAQMPPENHKIPETPARTVFVKHPAANDPATYFATTTNFTFYIYKPGNIKAVSSVFEREEDVETCTVGPLAGDYQEINLVLKSMKDKMWFISKFKQAGLLTIKINSNPIREIEKM